MSNPRIAVLAEGANEAPEGDWKVLSRQRLDDSHIGAAHVLVYRLICSLRGKLPVDAIQFEQPLGFRARRARGSDVLHSFKKLVTYPPQFRASDPEPPHVVVVFVDQDEDTERESLLQSKADTVPQPVAIGVAIQEFESWLLADLDTAGSVLAKRPASAPAGWLMKDAKMWVDEHGTDGATRRQLAEQLDLDVALSAAPSLQRFRNSLDAALASAGV